MVVKLEMGRRIRKLRMEMMMIRRRRRRRRRRTMIFFLGTPGRGLDHRLTGGKGETKFVFRLLHSPLRITRARSTWRPKADTRPP